MAREVLSKRRFPENLLCHRFGATNGAGAASHVHMAINCPSSLRPSRPGASTACSQNFMAFFPFLLQPPTVAGLLHGKHDRTTDDVKCEVLRPVATSKHWKPGILCKTWPREAPRSLRAVGTSRFRLWGGGGASRRLLQRSMPRLGAEAVGSWKDARHVRHVRQSCLA